jgi:outer membrane autotransporter protein
MTLLVIFISLIIILLETRVKKTQLNLASQNNLNHKLSYLAVTVALTILSTHAQAACLGTLASPTVGGAAATVTTQCSGAAGSNITNADAITYVDNSTKTNVGGNTLIQMDGQGRTITNSGSIINNQVINTGTSTSGNRNRVAVLMGNPTANNAAFTTSPTGSETNINIPNATAAYVGQTVIVGRYDSVEGDLFAGDVRTITAVVSGSGTTNAVVTLSAALSANPAPNGPQSLPLRYKVISNYGGGDGVVNNTGSISTQITLAEINGNKNAAGTASVSNTSSARAITAQAEGNYVVNNSATGVIQATHAGIGATYAVEAGGAATVVTINNDGLLLAERTATVSSPTFTATANPTGVVNGLAAQTLAQVNAINTQEELEALHLNNSATGIIRATGDYAGAIYMRAGEQTINNAGLIEHTAGKPGFAIGSVADGGRIRTLDLTNTATGIINGDILAVNGNALRYYGLITNGVPANSTLGINNQFGEEQSDIGNAGKINGNLYYANGAHVLENTATGKIVGNINVDQRDTTFAATTATCTPSASSTCQSVGTTKTAFDTNTQRIQTVTANGAANAFGQPVTVVTQFNVAGAKIFSLQNDGTMTGNLNIVNGQSDPAITVFNRVSNNTIENTGTWTGNITISDIVGVTNTVNLSDDGFTGNISASTGAGNNALNIDGEGSSHGNVSKFKTIKFAGTEYTLAATNTYEASNATLSTGLLNLLGNLKANTTTAAGTTLTGTGTNTGNLTVNGHVDLGIDTLHVAGNFAANAGAVISTNIDATGNGAIAATGTANITGVTIKPVVSTGYAVLDGATYDVVTSTGLTQSGNSINSTPLLNWGFVSNTNNLSIKATVNSNVAGLAGGTSAGSTTLNNVLTNSNNIASVGALGVALQGLSSSQDVAKAGQQLSPETNGAIFAAANTSINNISQVINTRLASQTVASNGATGIATGDSALDNSFWLQGFGFTGAQDKRNNADGYDVDAHGFAAGVDKAINDDLRLGLAVAYANTDTSATDTTKGNTNKADSYSAVVYGTQKFGTWYLDGQLGYAKHQFDSTRLVTVPVADIAKGSFDANQYFGKLSASYPIKVGPKTTLVPTVIANYSYLDQDGYTETSKAGAALSINGHSTDSFRTGFGAKALFNIGNEALPINLETRALWWHEFADVAQDTSARFAAGGTAFKVEGVRPARDSANLGASLNASAKDGSQSLTISYDADVRSQYLGHTASLTARFNF